jgi:hypothetical protein
MTKATPRSIQLQSPQVPQLAPQRRKIIVLNRAIRRAVGAVTTLAVCGLLTACGGEGGGGARPAADSASATTNTAGAGAGDSITVVFQLTGLLLAVPPKQAGDSMDVLLPTATHDSAHSARLGFGGDSTAICQEYYGNERICYVDLAKWSVAAIGSGGSPTDLSRTRFPAGVVNVTQGAGGIHHPMLPPDAAEVAAHVQFLAGQPIGTPCSLASWRYGPASQTGQPHPNPPTLELANVVNWGIRYPRNQPFQLVFTARDGSGTTETRTLVTADTVRVVLANVPTGELRHLPPNAAGAATNAPDSLVHFHDFYKLLRHQGTGQRPEQAFRPLPRYVASLEPNCRVTITSQTLDKRAVVAIGGIKTFGCVVGEG